MFWSPAGWLLSSGSEAGCWETFPRVPTGKCQARRSSGTGGTPPRFLAFTDTSRPCLIITDSTLFMQFLSLEHLLFSRQRILGDVAESSRYTCFPFTGHTDHGAGGPVTLWTGDRSDTCRVCDRLWSRKCTPLSPSCPVLTIPTQWKRDKIAFHTVADGRVSSNRTTPVTLFTPAGDLLFCWLLLHPRVCLL